MKVELIIELVERARLEGPCTGKSRQTLAESANKLTREVCHLCHCCAFCHRRPTGLLGVRHTLVCSDEWTREKC